ncbi:MAG: aminoacylase [Gemmatimonas sp.]|nr:aminoacylase [Gemmatimonas sp.]
MRRIAALLLVAATFSCALGAQRPPEWSLLIAGGTIVDGTGAARYTGDVAIFGDRIVQISREPLDRSRAARVIDARGLIVAPGFIDLHAHLEPLLEQPDAKSAVTQGVTLALGGPDGSGPFPLAAYLDSAQRAGLGMNVAYLVGHNTVRRMVMGTENRAPTADELARMTTLIRQGMGDGAFGISTGLRYVPGYYSKTDEVVALSRAAADSGGIYTSHLREEGLGLLEGVAEAITIARDARIPVVLTHHKAVGALMWGKTSVTLAMVDSARAAGLDVMVDQYPYTASQTSLSVLVPPWALAGGRDALRARLEQPALRDSIERGIVELLRTDRGGGDTRRVQFGSVSWDRSLEGKTLFDWAERRGVGPSLEAAAKLVLEGELNGGASMVYHIIDEGDVRRVMQHPQSMIASDGRLTRPGQGVPHPRAYGTFPRVLGHYVREEGVISLETAVHKMTGMPAKRLGLERQRGCLAPGCFADVAIFDAATVGSPATFDNPHQYATGIPYVVVNGVPVVDAGVFTDARPGRALRRPVAATAQSSAPARPLSTIGRQLPPNPSPVLRSSPPPDFFWEQVRAGAKYGAAGTLVGALAGMAIASAASRDTDDGWAELGGLVFGGVIGNVVAAPIGVIRISRARDVEGSALLSYLGSTLGMFGVAGGGVAFFFTVPAGATIGYNLGRR